MPKFESDLDIDLDYFETDEALFGCTDDNDDESVEKKGYDHDSDFELSEGKSNQNKKSKNEPLVKWNGKRFKRVYTVESSIDFTKGQTSVDKKLQIVDESICDIIEKSAV